MPLNASDVVTDMLQRYADRGIFRGFSVSRRRGGASEYRFAWLTPAPLTLTYDPRTGVLTFANLLPGVRSGTPLLADLRRFIEQRTGRGLPGHRRIDGRRARLACSVGRGGFTIALTARGPSPEYAVQRGLNLVHELFLFLHEGHPEYLVRHFGLSTE
jgi:hypothetical protein